MRGPAQGDSLSGGERNHLFLNLGGTDFLDASPISGLDSPADGRAAATLDIDRDGWLDFAVVNANAPLLQLFRNAIGQRAGAAGRPGFCALRFVGANDQASPRPGASARDGFGAIVELTVGGATLLREHRAGEGFAAQSSTTLLVGLGDAERIDALAVRWPSGVEQHHAGLPVGQLVTLYEDPASSPDGTGLATTPYRREVVLPPAAAAKDTPRLDLGAALGDGADATLRLHVTMATWCPSCRRELPQVARLRSAFDADELDLVGLPVDEEDDADKLSTYRTGKSPAYRLLEPLTAEQRQAITALVVEALGVEALPAAILTDGRGQVLAVLPRVPSVSEVARWLAHARDAGG